MTGREKAKWVWKNFYALVVCVAYASIAVVALGDACWRAFHREWLQFGKDLLMVPICLGGAVLIWKFFKWHDALCRRLFAKLDKGPKT